MTRASSPIYETTSIEEDGARRTRHYAQRADGQWFYRVSNGKRGMMGRWLMCDGRPESAWYNPAAGGARLPDGDESSEVERRHFEVKLISKFADLDVTFTGIPAASAGEAQAWALRYLARPDVWLPTDTKEVPSLTEQAMSAS